MVKRLIFRTAAILALAFLGGLESGSLRADFIYDVSIDTSSIAGTSGYLDFQFNPGGVSAPASITISNFQTTGGILAPFDPNIGTGDFGDATGMLPGTLTLDNGTQFNDVYQGFTFGTNYSFELDLSDPPAFPDGSSFAMTLYGSDGGTTLLSNNPDGSGSALRLDLSPDGLTVTTAYAAQGVIATPQGSGNPGGAVPEPSSLLLLVSALPVGLLVRRRLRRFSTNTESCCIH
jgi:hypothetical protein